jgi:UrcA family protein
MEESMKMGLMLVGLATVVAVAAPAMAQETAVVRGRLLTDLVVRTVSFADLNLVRASDQDRLQGRVDSAVGAVCRESLGPSPIYFAKVSCTKRAWRTAQPQIDRAIADAQLLSITGVASDYAVIRVAVRN